MQINNRENLYDYLYQNSSNPYFIDLLQYEINKRIYYFGDNFSNSWEKRRLKKSGKNQILEVLYKVLKSRSLKGHAHLILSNAYFSVNDKLRKNNFKVIIPWWCLKKGIYLRDYRLLKLFQELSPIINNAGIQELIAEDFQNKIVSFIDIANSLVASSRIKAGFFSNDLGFYERAFIDIFKNHNIPTFIYLHGLPARYNNVDDNRADYLMVWGNKIKDNYIKTGVDRNKIIVTGHPFYCDIKPNNLRFSFENILVISKPVNGAPSISNSIIISDRGNCLLYLMLVQKTLKSNGIKKVKLRIHPSENPQWYIENIDTDFYILETNNLKQALETATLVIGPTSTVFLESLHYGVNYVIYEPSINDNDLINYPLVNPFDGSDNKIPVAKNEDELNYILNNKIMVNPTCFRDFISTPFDISFVKNLIK